MPGGCRFKVGAHYLEQSQGGRGILLSGVAGVAPAHVVVLGAGMVGAAGVRIAVGMGAQVSVFNLDLQDFDTWMTFTRPGGHSCGSSSLDRSGSSASGSRRRRRHGTRRASPSGSFPNRRLAHETGSVIVDVSVDQGGCIETIKPTTHSDPVYSLMASSLWRHQYAGHCAADIDFGLDQRDASLYSPACFCGYRLGDSLRS